MLAAVITVISVGIVNSKGYKPFQGPIETKIISPLPHTLYKASGNVNCVLVDILCMFPFQICQFHLIGEILMGLIIAVVYWINAIQLFVDHVGQKLLWVLWVIDLLSLLKERLKYSLLRKFSLHLTKELLVNEIWYAFHINYIYVYM